MKCRVCGCEFDSDRAHCPKCGSKAQEEIKTPNTEEFSWNTYDFPKPQSVSNIDMSWPSMNSSPSDAVTVMSRDASEGYFASENKPSVQPQPQMTWTVPPVQQPVYQQPVQQAPVQQPVQQQQPVQPVMQQQPVYQQPVQQPQVQFTAGTWRMPSMQPEPTWTPYNVQAQPVSTQAPQTTPLYVPQFQQPAQPAWTIPPQPQQPVYVAQPAQPVYIQAQPVYQQPVQQAPIQQPVQQQQPVQPVMQQPVYQQVPVYQQPVMQQVPLYMTQPVPSQQMPLQQAPQEPAAGDIPTFGQVAQQAQQAQAPQEPVQQPEKEEMPKAEQPEADKVLEENIVAGAGVVSQPPKYEEEHHVYEPDE
ncbi:MAG: hypothetical protein MJ186_05715, partial [Clostridia bacterium]|nr:hypothetical protein [Clostridia bacterium]